MSATRTKEDGYKWEDEFLSIDIPEDTGYASRFRPYTLSAAGFALERALEPGPSARQAELVPGNREVPTLLLIRAHLSDDRQTEKGSKG